MEELRPGLWFWKGPHPDWTPESGGPTGWEREVSSYAYDTGPVLVLFDPIAPPSLLDELASGKDVAVLLTCEWHARSADDAVERLGASVWKPEEAGELPEGVEARRAYFGGEVVFWLPALAALVAGDALVTREGGRLERPPTWLEPGDDPEAARQALLPLLELPVELVLTTHGDPIRENGGEALRGALLESSA